jgi:MFS transporter, putative metabolite:H+ symporter
MHAEVTELSEGIVFQYAKECSSPTFACLQTPRRMTSKIHHSPFNLVVLAAGLGFFIDTFDIFLFNVYRVSSLKELGLQGAELTRAGEYLLSMQMLGMMIGGVLSGVIADKKGRVAVLFGSIVLYSVANILNAFITDVDAYAWVRFLAGVGLAGELGAGITLVGESMSIEKRGYGTILVATLGGLGAVTAGLVGDFLPWRVAFGCAGGVGFMLLLLRMKSMETVHFRESLTTSHPKGSLLHLFRNRRRALRYLACIGMGVPIWYSVGLLITLSTELAAEHGISNLNAGLCFILFQVGVTTGDLSSGVLSQWLKSRKKVLLLFMSLAIIATVLHFNQLFHSSPISFTSFLIGLGCGYLSVFVTATSEHFGTNLRVTVTATVTNFMRGAVTLLIPLRILIQESLGTDISASLIWVGIIVWLPALLAAAMMPETYGRDLGFVEE